MWHPGGFGRAPDALVVAPGERFEFVGETSPAFRIAASCVNTGGNGPFRRTDRAWPIEVCGAAFEEPGLTDTLASAE